MGFFISLENPILLVRQPGRVKAPGRRQRPAAITPACKARLAGEALGRMDNYEGFFWRDKFIKIKNVKQKERRRRLKGMEWWVAL